MSKYASFASKSSPPVGKTPLSANIAVRIRGAGLQALRSLVSADSFAADNGRLLRTVMPAILDNVYSESGDYLSRLRLRETMREEKDQDPHVRQSLTDSRTDGSTDNGPSTAFETTEHADERANEDISLLALQTLRQIFATEVPGHLRIGTQCAVAFMKKHGEASGTFDSKQSTALENLSSWSCEILENVARWTTVQNRFVVLVTLTDALTRSPITEDDLNNQLLLVRVIAHLLRSDITFLGLSVNDVLIGFINHILLLLQLGGPGSGVKPHRQQDVSHGLLGVANNPSRDQSPASGRVDQMQPVRFASDQRIQLLNELSLAIGDLAAHVYYADQVSEMVSALLARLKPPISVISTAAAAIDDPTATADAIAESGRLQEDSRTDSYFSFDTARVLALNSIRSIIETANARRKDGQAAGDRNRVGVPVWDGTQWLLRDPCGKVRRAYVNTILTWISLELDKSNLRVSHDLAKRAKSSKHDSHHINGSAVAKRAISNASKRSSPNVRAQSTFLPLLHLAIYDNALHYAESEADMLLLHLLLVSLIQKLGVNAVRHGLPMIFHLQEDIPALASITAKDAVGSLVHGYFWALSEFFDFDSSKIGRDISNEISRRSQLGLWLGPINVPALPLEMIGDPPDSPPTPRPTTASQKAYSLHPLLDRQEIVDRIGGAYITSMASPPISPPASPRKGLSPRVSAVNAPTLLAPDEDALPGDARDQLMHSWTRETCIAEVEKKLARSSSVTNSKSGSGSGRAAAGFLTANGTASGGRTPEGGKSRNVSEIDLHRPQSQGNPSPQSLPDRSSASAPASGLTRNSLRVNDLKRILETGQPPSFSHYRFSRSVPGSDRDSESMVSAAVSSVI